MGEGVCTDPHTELEGRPILRGCRSCYIAELQTENAALVAALRPFADAAQWADRHDRADDWDIEGCLMLKAGDLRAARAALAAGTGEGNEATTAP